MRVARLQGVNHCKQRHDVSGRLPAVLEDQAASAGRSLITCAPTWSADAIEMMRWRRKPVGTIVDSGRVAQSTCWLFGARLRDGELTGSMGKVASARDNAWIEAFYNPVPCHSGIAYHSPNWVCEFSSPQF